MRRCDVLSISFWAPKFLWPNITAGQFTNKFIFQARVIQKTCFSITVPFENLSCICSDWFHLEILVYTSPLSDTRNMIQLTRDSCHIKQSGFAQFNLGNCIFYIILTCVSIKYLGLWNHNVYYFKQSSLTR